MALAESGTQSMRVAAHLRTAIECGDLPPAQPLPSFRELARELDVAVNTVRAAYDMLKAEQLIRKAWGSYVVVSATELALARTSALEREMNRFRARLAAEGYTNPREIERAWRASGGGAK